MDKENRALITDYQTYLFKTGVNYNIYEMLGAHPIELDGVGGYRFAVWAPNAASVSVVGDFNDWDSNKNVMEDIYSSGIWCVFVSGVSDGMCYKFQITTKNGDVLLKIDPCAFAFELPPKTASLTARLDKHQWQDEKWVKSRKKSECYSKPMSIYEVHLGSWRLNEDREFYTYRELADSLLDYVSDMGYTHIELLPISEHPFDGSWGYQVSGYFAATARYGSPEDLMYFVDKCHQKNIGVLIDWVPAHFPKDAHALARYDGTALYEFEDSRIGEHLEWGTLVFNYRRHEVISFLISNAVFWLDKFHIDGLRVDAVSSMLYLNYGRQNYLLNCHGGVDNLDAIDFLKRLNEVVNRYYPETIMIAEESTSWPMMTKPTYIGGLGFDFKWNMGWMNDILKYMALDPIYRKYNHNLLTFSLMYAFSENYILPISHDEVVHGKKSLIDKMPGDYWQKFANVRLFLAYMYAHPGKKLLFMGNDYGQFIEWKYKDSLDWHLLEYEMHGKLHSFSKILHKHYIDCKAFWEVEDSWEGFNWIDANDDENSIISFSRIGKNSKDTVIVICNFTPVVREGYRVGVDEVGNYIEALNTDDTEFGGSGVLNSGVLVAEKIPHNYKPYSLKLNLPPLAAVYIIKRKRGGLRNGK